MKKELRKKYLSLRDSLTETEVCEFSAQAAERLFATAEYLHASVIFVYFGVGCEISTTGIIERALSDGKHVCIPHITGKGIMQAVRISSASSIEPGAFGIPTVTPDDGNAVSPDEIDLCVVPGVAFDRQLNRLGRGGGYYDIFLARVGSDCVKAGLAYSAQIAERLPADETDIKMDLIITEKEIIRDNF